MNMCPSQVSPPRTPGNNEYVPPHVSPPRTPGSNEYVPLPKGAATVVVSGGGYRRVAARGGGDRVDSGVVALLDLVDKRRRKSFPRRSGGPGIRRVVAGKWERRESMYFPPGSLTYNQKKQDKIATLHNEGLKNCLQKVETASGLLPPLDDQATASEEIVTASGLLAVIKKP
ncbi:hypothetical protein Tco_0592688 [Tanacetum coccineum]